MTEETKAHAQPPEPRFMTCDAMRIVGLSRSYTGETMGEIPQQWAAFGPHLGNIPGLTGERAFGLCTTTSRSPFQLDYMTGVAVTEDAPVPEGMTETRVPAGRMAVFSHEGSLSGIQPLVHAIFTQWLPQSGETPAAAPDFLEVYGPAFDAASGTGKVDIWVPLRN